MAEEGEKELDQMITGLPLGEKVPVLALKGLLDQHHNIDNQENAEIEEINRKYMKLTEPLNIRAGEILKGAALTADEAKYVEAHIGEPLGNLVKGLKVPGYWAQVLMNSKVRELITEDDMPALKALQNISFTLEGSDIVKLTFEFADNPHFPACTIKRELIVENEEVVESRGDLIPWKAGKSLTHEEKTVTNKKTGEKKVTQGEMRPSMFHFFRNDTNKTEDELKHLDIQQMIVNELTHSIIPYSLEYYLGLNPEMDDMDDEGDDEEEGSEQPS